MTAIWIVRSENWWDGERRCQPCATAAGAMACALRAVNEMRRVMDLPEATSPEEWAEAFEGVLAARRRAGRVWKDVSVKIQPADLLP